FEKGLDLVPAGAVHQPIGALDTPMQRCDEVVDRHVVGEIERQIFDGVRPQGSLCCSRSAARLVDISDEDPRPLAGQQKRGGLADAGRAAGDDDGLLLQLHRCLRSTPMPRPWAISVNIVPSGTISIKYEPILIDYSPSSVRQRGSRWHPLPKM